MGQTSYLNDLISTERVEKELEELTLKKKKLRLIIEDGLLSSIKIQYPGQDAEFILNNNPDVVTLKNDIYNKYSEKIDSKLNHLEYLINELK
jgi:hypothetical protein